MAQIDSIPTLSLEAVTKKMDDSEGHPVKKFKQARLPFMPIDHEQKTLKTTTPPGSKKRKLSDNDSPSAKQAKVSVKPLKPPSPNGEAEVSSSSEADPLPATGQQKGAKKVSTLDRFLFKKREVQEEITSTNDCVPMAIDLTDEAESEALDSAARNKSENIDCAAINKSEAVDSADNKTETDSAAEKTTDSKSAEVSDNSDNKENIERTSVTIEDDADMNQSFVSDTSVCEAALKTPAKDKPLESVLNTPVVTGKKEVSSTVTQSPGTASDATPVSGKKRAKPLSESQKKERETVRQQKEKEKEEKRLQKEREKEEKEKERLEKKKQKDEEKAEKEKQRQEEKDKKEKERLEKLQKKEEEKKKKEEQIEAKMEEKRKKDEEKRQKEEEKRLKEEEKLKEEEEKLKKKEKVAQSFKSFFIEKAPTVSPPKVKEGKSQFFMPFEMKPGMKLAPTLRVADFSTDGRAMLDQCLQQQGREDLYLAELKKGTHKKRKSSKTFSRELNVDKDVEIMSHDEETIQKTLHKVKFLKFNENTRPPYYGTWTKPTTKLSARNPFKQDEALFDYEVDSDDEWEEEDPGESVSSDEEEEDKDKEKDEDEEDADGWMVPHGYLSDDEGIDNEEDMDASKKHQLQAARQEAWEREIKMQTQPLKMNRIGCFWEGETTTIAAKQLEKLLSFKAVCLRGDPIPTHYSRQEGGDSVTSQSDKTDGKLTTPGPTKKRSVPEEAMPDLIKLLHGNPSGIKKLIKEFRMFWKLKTCPEAATLSDHKDISSGESQDISQEDNKQDVAGPDDSGMEVDENNDAPNTPPNDKSDADTSKTDPHGGFAISNRQLDIKIPLIAVREKRSDIKVTCWYVKDEVLKQYGLEDIQLPNTWEYVHVKAPHWASNKATPKSEETAANKIAPSSGTATPTFPNIMQFAQTMSPAQIQAQRPIGSPSTSKASIKPSETTAEKEVNETKTEGQTEEKLLPVPKDQISIKNFFKLATNGPKPVAVKSDDGSKNDKVIKTSDLTKTTPNKVEKNDDNQKVNTKAVKASPKGSSIKVKNDELQASPKGSTIKVKYELRVKASPKGSTIKVKNDELRASPKGSAIKVKNDELRVKPLKRVSTGTVGTPVEKLLKATPLTEDPKVGSSPTDVKPSTDIKGSDEPMEQDVIVLD